jgi:hypothetical protein
LIVQNTKQQIKEKQRGKRAQGRKEEAFEESY